LTIDWLHPFDKHTLVSLSKICQFSFRAFRGLYKANELTTQMRSVQYSVHFVSSVCCKYVLICVMLQRSSVRWRPLISWKNFSLNWPRHVRNWQTSPSRTVISWPARFYTQYQLSDYKLLLVIAG